MNQKLIVRIFFIFSYFTLLFITLTTIFLGNIPFWFDPARDLFSGISNHQKISLIGQTSGIPGIFYGPYWIWLISLSQFISLNPRVVALLVLTIPYFILLPTVLIKFKNIFSVSVMSILWILLMISFSAYSSQIWNPHLAPFFCIITILILMSNEYEHFNKNFVYNSVISGIAAGLVMNFHISFGLCLIFGAYIFLFTRKNKIRSLLLFSAGVVIAFLPFFLFEIRHGFNQIKTLLSTVNNNNSVVSDVSNIDRIKIITHFLDRFSQLMGVPKLVGYIILISSFLYTVVMHKKKRLVLGKIEKNILLLLSCICIATIFVYFSSKNPIWEYHFIGVEVLFLFLIGIFINKSLHLKKVLIVWLVVLISLKIFSFQNELTRNPHKISTLRTKEHIVDIVYKDSNTNNFSYFAFNPTSLTPDYDYLFYWRSEQKKASNLVTVNNSRYVYLIIPWTTKDLREDFIDNRTPHEEYRTVRSWHIDDETTILKREKYEK